MRGVCGPWVKKLRKNWQQFLSTFETKFIENYIIYFKFEFYL